MDDLRPAVEPTLLVDRQNQTGLANPSDVAQEELHRRFLDTSSIEALAAWNDLLRLQVEVFAADELAFLARFAPWQNAMDILDVGCGNGLYLSALRSRFRGKSYTGIDVSAGLIAEARANDASIEFAVADFFDFVPDRKFDLIMMRFLIQHLTNFTAVLDRCSGLVGPQGGVLIIEPDLGNSRNDPPTPLFEDLLLKFERSRNDNGRMRIRITDPDQLLSGSQDWEVIANQAVEIQPSAPSAQRAAGVLFLRWVDTFERSGLLEYPFRETREELKRWADAAGASTTITLRAVYLARSIPRRRSLQSGSLRP
jgi:trans-aconitate methyltransferase